MKQAILYNYCNFPIYYRLEDREVGQTIVLSYRPIKVGSDRPGKMIYEGKPHVLSKEQLSDWATSCETVLEELVPPFLLQLYATKDKLAVAMRPERNMLPLAVAWKLSREAMCQEFGWSKSTLCEYDWAFQALLKSWGSYPWQEVTPALCAPMLMHWSPRKQDACIRAIRQLFLYQGMIGVSTRSDPWANYAITGRRKGPSHSASLARHIEETVLTHEQCRALIAGCMENLHLRSDGSLYLAMLLLLTLGLLPEELCGLSQESVSCLSRYPFRSVFRITADYCSAEKNHSCTLRQIVDPYRIRMLPVPALVMDALNRFRSRLPSPLPAESALIPHPKNKFRYLPPEYFKSWLTKTVPKLLGQELDKKLTASSAVRLLQTTCKRNLAQCGYEEEELNYHLGRHPQLVSARHYCDFGNEAQLNKMGALQERWCKTLYSDPKSAVPSAQSVLTRKGSACHWSIVGQRCHADLQFSIHSGDALPHKGLLLQLSSPHGLSLTAIFC